MCSELLLDFNFSAVWAWEGWHICTKSCRGSLVGCEDKPQVHFYWMLQLMSLFSAFPHPKLLVHGSSLCCCSHVESLCPFNSVPGLPIPNFWNSRYFQYVIVPEIMFDIWRSSLMKGTTSFNHLFSKTDCLWLYLCLNKRIHNLLNALNQGNILQWRIKRCPCSQNIILDMTMW